MTRELLQLLNALDGEQYITTSQLKEIFLCSKKTLRSRLRELDEMLKKQEAHIESKRGGGYRLVVDRPDLFAAWKEGELKKLQKAIPSSVSERTAYLLFIFMERKDWIKREELAEFLCVSEKTISADMKHIAFILGQYDLEIERRPAYGMRVAGHEFRKRQCILNQLLLAKRESFLESFIKPETMERMSRLTTEKIREFDMSFSEFPYRNLLLYLAILIHRVKHGFVIVGEECREWKKDVGIYRVSEAILKGLAEEGLIESYEEGEVYYTSLFFWGNRMMENSPENNTNYVILPHIEKLVNAMLITIYESFGLDFSKDLNLRMCLLHHMAALDIRLVYNIPLKNQYLEEIKEKYFFAFLLARQAVFCIEEHFGKKLSEDEVGYFAMLFAMKLNEETARVRKSRILLLCATGKIGSRFLKFRLEEEFRDYIERIDMYSIYEMEKIDLDQYDYIFSTVSVDLKVPVPIVMIHDFFAQSEMLDLHRKLSQLENRGNISSFYRKELFFPETPGESREEVIRFLCGQVEKVCPLPEEAFELVMEREALGGTDFGGGIAMPHPVKIITEETIAAVGILKKPVFWEKHEVELVVLAFVAHSGSPETQRFFDMTARVLLDSEAVKKVIEGRSYESFLEQLVIKNGIQTSPA